MSLLQQHIKAARSADDGVAAYIAEVTNRYYRQVPALGGHYVTCKWILGYVSKTDMVAMGCLLPVILFGHFFLRQSNAKFQTVHVMRLEDAKRFRRASRLRNFLLPLVTILVLAIVVISFLTLFFSVLFLFWDPTPPQMANQPHGEPHPMVMAVVVLIYVTLYLGARKFQIYLRKIGLPPRTNEFTDQRIKLESISIE